MNFALRSIEKHLRGYGQIFIVGDKPSWLKNVIHIPASDEPYVKERNIMTKTLLACKDERVSDDFISWHDDLFILHPICYTEIKYWHDGTLEEAKSKSRGGYKTAIQNTIDNLKIHGLNFDIHAPIIYNKEKFQESMKDWSREYVIKSRYANRWASEAVEMKDLKLNAPYKVETIKQKIKDRLFFSTGPFGLQPELCEVLNELYPNPSKYE